MKLLFSGFETEFLIKSYATSILLCVMTNGFLQEAATAAGDKYPMAFTVFLVLDAITYPYTALLVSTLKKGIARAAYGNLTVWVFLAILSFAFYFISVILFPFALAYYMIQKTKKETEELQRQQQEQYFQQQYLQQQYMQNPQLPHNQQYPQQPQYPQDPNNNNAF